METVWNIETAPAIHKLKHNHIIYREKRRQVMRPPEQETKLQMHLHILHSYWIKIVKSNL